MIEINVPLGDRAYDVAVGVFSPQAVADRFASALGATSGLAVLVDGQLARVSPRVPALVGALGDRFAGVPVRLFELPPGESAKSLTAIERTCEWMAQQGFDRGAAIVAVGGGAATDHAGFTAAIYLRGIRFVSVSTTLLGMVDASVGGKTGVDLPAGKNLVGAFHQPRAVVADLGFLETLPRREQAAGLAEVVKAGLIADASLFERLESDAAVGRIFAQDALAEIVAAAVRVKVAVVAEDERESGRRAILNFGHTIGHAVESASGYDLLHGEAVALGMVAALALGEARGVSDAALRPRTIALLEKIGLPVDIERRLGVGDEVLRRIEVDKKRRSDQVRFVFVPRIGEATLVDVPLREVGPAVRRALGG